MARRKTFDPRAVPPAFWRRDDVRRALLNREIGRFFGVYLATFPECTQTQLALLTGHDRSDISNFVRGVRSPRVVDIDVLDRIASGLTMPDEARVLLGLAPVSATSSRADSTPPSSGAGPAVTGWFQPINAARKFRIAICGSKSTESNSSAIDDAIRALSRFLIRCKYEVDHGPLGVGIEIMTYIADHYRPPTLRAAVGVFGRPNVVRHADFVIVIGGGQGTLDEVDLAFSMGKRLLPFVPSGGAAGRCYERMLTDVRLRAWLSNDLFTALGSCTSADEFVNLVEQVLMEEGADP